MQSSLTRCAKTRPGAVNDSVTASMTSPAEASRQLLKKRFVLGNLFMTFSFQGFGGNSCRDKGGGWLHPL